MLRARAIILAVLIPVGLALAYDDPFAFMPDGGRLLFAQVFVETDAQALALSQDRTAQDWLEEISGRYPALEARQAETLAAYLSKVAPLPVNKSDPTDALPPDGKELALAQCQSCHGLFSGYLMHRRDRAGWLATFASPFHSGIAMTDAEKAIFADYSAINMPMRFEDVPPELRF